MCTLIFLILMILSLDSSFPVNCRVRNIKSPGMSYARADPNAWAKLWVIFEIVSQFLYE